MTHADGTIPRPDRACGSPRPSAPAGSRIAGLGHFRPGPGRHQRRAVADHGHQRRVDPQPGRHRRAPVRRRGRHGRVDGRPGQREGAGRGRHCSPPDIDTVIVATCSLDSAGAARGHPDRRRAGHPRARVVRPQRRLRRLLLRARRRRPRRPDRSARTNVLVVGSEKLTDWTEPDDRATAIIFADGAGAAVVTGSAEPEIGPVVWGSDETNARGDPDRRPERLLHPGGPDRLPLGDHGDRAGRGPRGGGRRRRARPTSTCWSPTRRTCGSSRPSPRR